MGDGVQNTQCTATKGESVHQAMVSKPSTLSARRTAQRAQTTFGRTLQLLWRERQHSQLEPTVILHRANVVQVAVPSQPAQTSQLGALSAVAEALPTTQSTHHGQHLGLNTASQLSGRAGWWKSPCPVLVRAPDEQSPGLLYDVVQGACRRVPPYDLARRKEAPLGNNSCAIANHWLTSIVSGLQRRQVHASACIGRRSGFTLWVNSNTANNLNQNQWLTPTLSGQLPDLGSCLGSARARSSRVRRRQVDSKRLFKCSNSGKYRRVVWNPHVAKPLPRSRFTF